MRERETGGGGVLSIKQIHSLVTLGGTRLADFSCLIVSTGALSANLIFLIPSRTSSQFAGASATEKLRFNFTPVSEIRKIVDAKHPFYWVFCHLNLNYQIIEAINSFYQ